MTEEELALHAKRTIEQHLLASDPSDPSHLNALRPLSADYVDLFGDLATEVQDGYASLWSAGLPRVAPRQTQVRVAVGSAGAIAAGDQAGFPGGFVQIAGELPPASIWVAFKCVEPGKSAGMAFDGLCWRGEGRWAWFPKVWRMLKQG